MITDGIVSLLKSDPTLSALTTEIRPVGMVKGMKSPAIVYHIGTALPQYDAAGDSGYMMARLQFDSYSSLSYTEARNVAKALRDVLKNLKNTTLTDGTFVRASFANPPIDMPFVAEGVQTIEYRVMVEVAIHYLE
jgi:hypothetical protein